MEIRLAAEALSRLALASPARTRAPSKVACQCRQLHLPTTPYRQRNSISRWAQKRDISASSARRAPPAGAASATATPTDQSAPDHVAYTSRQSGRKRQEMPSDDEIASIVDQSFRDFDPTSRPSRLSPDSTQQTNRRLSDHPLGQNTTNNTYMGRRAGGEAEQSTADLFEAAMQQDSGRAARRPQSSAGFIDGFTVANTLTDKKASSDPFADLESLVDMASSRRGLSPIARQLPKSSLRLGSSVGRSIEIDPSRGVDLSKGINQLETRLSINRVRTEVRRQKFHERPGLRRKRLKTARWRAKFKVGFQAVVKRVKYLTQMGW